MSFAQSYLLVCIHDSQDRGMTGKDFQLSLELFGLGRKEGTQASPIFKP